MKNKENATILCDYIQAEQTEFNIKDSTKEGKIKVLVWLSNFFDDEVSFKQMKKSHILSFFNKSRGPGTDDPAHKVLINATLLVDKKAHR